MRARMQADLARALKGGDRSIVAALRSAIAAIDNAEAVEVTQPDPRHRGSEHVAGAALGLGAAERPRRVLSAEEITSIVVTEREQHLDAAHHAASAARADLADRHLRQAAVLGAYLEQDRCE